MQLLVIEDDRNLSDAVCGSIGDKFQTRQAFDGEEGLFYAKQNVFDMIILDIMLPSLDGYEVLTQLRAEGISTPVLLLTAKDGIDDKIKGLKAGADDYLVKPFHREELLARLEAILRRSGGGAWEDTLEFADITLIPKSRSVTVAGEPVELQGKQYDLLEYLMRNKEMILTKEQIFDRIWGFDCASTANVVEVYASKLRGALKPYGMDRCIKTVRGMGYMLTSNGERYE